MLRILSIVIALMVHGCGCTGVFAQSFIEQQAQTSDNRLRNPGFENGLGSSTGWTIASECSLSVASYQGQRAILCTNVTSAKTLWEQTVTVSNHIPFIDQMWAAYSHVAASVNNNIQVCFLFNGSEVNCQSVQSGEVSLDAEGYKQYLSAYRLTGLTSSFTAGIRVKSTLTTSTSVRGDANFVGPYTGIVGIIPEPQVFSALIQSNGTISVQTGGTWLQSCTNATTPVCTFTSGWFGGTVPQCWHSIAGNQHYVGATATDATTVKGDIINTSGVAQSVARRYFCKRIPGDPKYQANTTAEVIGLVPDETVFSARVNAEGVVLDETGDWINGNATVSDTSTYTISILNFTATPACTVTPITNSSISVDAKLLTVSATQVQVKTFTSTTSNSAAAAFHIECQRQGTDYTAARNRFQNIPFGNVHISAYASSDQSIPTSTVTTVVMNQIVEQIGPISINTATGVVTIQEDGLYLITGQVTYGTGGTGARHFYIRDLTNGINLVNHAVPGTAAIRPNGSKVVNLQAGHQVAIGTFQTSGAALSTSGVGRAETFITVTKIGP